MKIGYNEFAFSTREYYEPNGIEFDSFHLHKIINLIKLIKFRIFFSNHIYL